MNNLSLGRLIVGKDVIIPFLASQEIMLQELLTAASSFARFVNAKQTMGLQPQWEFPNLAVTAKEGLLNVKSNDLTLSAAAFFRKYEQEDQDRFEWDIEITGFTDYREAAESKSETTKRF